MGIDSQDKTNDLDQPVVSVADPVTGLQANVTLESGINKLNILGTFVSSVSLGRDPVPDSWFRIDNAGTTGDTIRIQLAGTTNDPSAPDRDLPAFDKTFTVLASEIGKEVELAARIVSEIKADAGAASSEITAILVPDDENAVVFISSTKRGEFFKRTGVSFSVTPTGSAATTLGFNDFIQRQKEVELSRGEDPRLGIPGFSGTFVIQPGAVSDRFELELTEPGGSSVLSAFDGSVTPVEFTLIDNPDFDETLDHFITSITVHGLDNGIKLSNFLGQNSALTNGLTWDIKAQDKDFDFPSIASTREIKRFATSGGWELDIESGNDDALAIKDFGITPIEIVNSGEFTVADFFRITVNDDLTSISDLKIILNGFRKEP